MIGDMVHLSAHTATDPAAVDALGSYYRGHSASRKSQRVCVPGSLNFEAISKTPRCGTRNEATCTHAGYQSKLWVPLLRDGVAFGTINVTRAEPGPFSDHTRSNCSKPSPTGR